MSAIEKISCYVRITSVSKRIWKIEGFQLSAFSSRPSALGQTERLWPTAES